MQRQIFEIWEPQHSGALWDCRRAAHVLLYLYLFTTTTTTLLLLLLLQQLLLLLLQLLLLLLLLLLLVVVSVVVVVVTVIIIIIIIMCTIFFGVRIIQVLAPLLFSLRNQKWNKVNNLLQFVVHIEIVHADVFGYITVRYSCCWSSFKRVILFQDLVYLKLQKGGQNQKG